MYVLLYRAPVFQRKCYFFGPLYAAEAGILGYQRQSVLVLM